MPKSSEEDLMNAMLKLVYAFLGRPESAPFAEPVDWKQLGLLDYPALVKKPMDLGTIRVRAMLVILCICYPNCINIQDKILMKGYSSADDIAGDIRLVWTNCMTYNQVGAITLP